MAALHGGAFWREVGNRLDRLDGIVRADVLDAWFPPGSSVLELLAKYSVELVRTSPEADAAPLRAAISQSRGIAEESILTMNGSSALIFLALPFLARRARSGLVLDPMYGEYRHVLENLCGLRVDTLPLSWDDCYALDPARLLETSADILVLVNPNSPTGMHVPRNRLLPIVEEVARKRIVWIDETYVEYAGEGESLEGLAATTPNVIVCKSMSKVYALSGLRVGYLVAHPHTIGQLRRLCPPWSVSLPAQVCASAALEERDYYGSRWLETARLRSELRADIETLGLEVVEGAINSVLVRLPRAGPTAADVCERASSQGIYLRDAASMGATMGERTLRISVRDHHESARIVNALRTSLDSGLVTCPISIA